MRITAKTGCIVGILLFAVVGLGYGQSELHSAEEQIKAAVSAAPESMQKEATVIGYNEKGDLEELREGSNSLVCVADDPEQSNFHVSCYHKDLRPFMSRGRDLREQGFSRKKIDSLRREEIEAGTLKMPGKPMALYSLTGSKDAFNYETGLIRSAKPLYVIYIPYATQATTGLSKRPASKGAPWIMEPGTPWAHIMVITGRDIGNSMQKSQ